MYRKEAQFELLDPVGGEFVPISKSDLEMLSSVSSDSSKPTAAWIAEAGVDESAVRRLFESGALVDPDEAQWRARNSVSWHPVAAMFHSFSLHGDTAASATNGTRATIDLEEKRRNSEVDVSKHIEKHGKAPPPRLRFSARSLKGDGEAKPIVLPVEEPPNDAFFETLAERRTWRHFENLPMDRGRLSTLLRWTFGVHGAVHIGHQHIVALKTSPSGGAMHPIEAFPIVLSVEGIESGIYHYDSFGHTLEPLYKAPREELSELAVQLASGQEFAGDAGVLVLLVARLARNFWKYPSSARTYAVIHQDAGHLSQTFYLASTRLGLGSFYTAAVNGSVTRELLGLEDSVDAPMGLCGCGVPAEDKENWLGRERYVPRRSTLDVPEEIRRSQSRKEESDGSVECAEHRSGIFGFGQLRLSQPSDEE